MPPQVESRPDPDRRETEAERIDRNLIELLQELRITGIGVQVIFAFLLSLPFTERFSQLDGAQKTLYVADLLMAAIAIALLTAPVAHHRLQFRQHRKALVLHRANVMAMLGLVAVGLTVSGSVLLTISVVYKGIAVPLLGALIAAFIFALWFVVPQLGKEREHY